MNVSSIMTRNPMVCFESTTLEQCARMMLDCDCGEIPVVNPQDSNRVVGVITDRDIVMRTIALGKEPLKLTVSDCFSKLRFTVKEESSHEDCLKIMERHRVRRLPVVDDNGNCVGMVSQADLSREVTDRESASLLRKVSVPSETNAGSAPF